MKLLRKLKKSQNKKLDVLTTTSNAKGFQGLLETFIRSFRNFAFAGLLSPIIVLCCTLMGISLVPAIYVFNFFSSISSNWSEPLHYLGIGCGISFGYVTYGMTLIFVVPLANLLLPLRIKPWRGIWYSNQSIPWFIHNALTYIVRYTFLEFLTPSPFNVLFYKMMGMKIGKGCVINSSNISDPCLIELGDYVTIGGSAHLVAHYGQKGMLILAPIKIGNGTTIGLKASIMGDVTIGQNCLIKPHQVVLPKTVIPDGETV